MYNNKDYANAIEYYELCVEDSLLNLTEQYGSLTTIWKSKMKNSKQIQN